MVRSSYVRKLSFNDVGFWFVIVRYLLLNSYVTLGLQRQFLIKSGIHHYFVRSGYVWRLRHNYVASSFVNLLYLFLCQNCVINCFLTMTYFSRRFHEVALCMEITLKICFVFVRHCNVFFITSQLLYLFVLCTYVYLRP